MTLNVCAAVLTIPARLAYRLFAVVRSVERMPGRSAAVRPVVLARADPQRVGGHDAGVVERA